MDAALPSLPSLPTVCQITRNSLCVIGRIRRFHMHIQRTHGPFWASHPRCHLPRFSTQALALPTVIPNGASPSDAVNCETAKTFFLLKNFHRLPTLLARIIHFRLVSLIGPPTPAVTTPPQSYEVLDVLSRCSRAAHTDVIYPPSRSLHVHGCDCPVRAVLLSFLHAREAEAEASA